MRTAILATLVVAALAPTAARADEPCPVNGLDCLAVSQFSATADAMVHLALIATPVNVWFTCIALYCSP